MSIEMQFDPQWEAAIDRARLDHAIRTTLAHEGVPNEAALSFVVVGDDEMVRLNESYRGRAYTTDVLTFPYTSDAADAASAEEMRDYLGDVIVCYEQAARQGDEEGHAVQAELELLAVHGTLHLLGYDDETADEKARMWESQRAILEQLNLGHIAPAL